VKVLVLFNNKIEDEEVAAIGEILKVNNRLEIFSLIRTCITGQGATALAECLKFNFPLKTLRMTAHYFTETSE
jgi:hypothetical protein